MFSTTTGRYEFEGSETASREIAAALDGYYMVTLVASHDLLRVSSNANMQGYLERLRDNPVSFLLSPGSKLYARPGDSTPATISVVLSPVPLDFVLRALNALVCGRGV